MEWENIVERLNGLLESGRHGEMRGALMMLKEVDIAQYLETLSPEKMLMVFRILPKDVSSEVFAYMDTDQRQQLVESISDTEAAALVDEMFIDDAVDFLEELPANVVRRVLQNTSTERRDIINQFLRYPPNSAGSIMTIEYCEARAAQTVEQTIEEIKRTGLDKETVYTIYVIDECRQLTGTVALRKLIMASNSTIIEQIMDANAISVVTTDDQETVADTVRRYDLMSIPVVDKENRLVGIITADDVMDVIEEENTEDFEKMGALIPSEDEYIKTPVVRLALNRLPWLIFLLIMGFFTGQIITHYDELLTESGLIGSILIASIPMLMDTGGNCGSQSSTLVIRSLALGEIKTGDLFKILWTELRVSMIIGVVLAIVGYLRNVFMSLVNHGGHVQWEYNNVWIVVSISLMLTTIIAKALGCVLPLLAKKLKLDPALMASPIITTIVDAAALSVMFGIASVTLLNMAG